MVGGWESRGRRVGGPLALSVCVALAGCVTLPQAQAPDHPMSQANEYMAELSTARSIAYRERLAKSNKLDDQLLAKVPVKPSPAMTPRPRVTEGPGYRRLEETYFGGSSVDSSDWTEAFRRACSRQGGRLVGDSFCTAEGDPDRVLFMVTVRRGGGDGKAWFDITVVEPTLQPPSVDYVRLVMTAGFVTQAMQEANTRAAEMSAARRAADERARLALDWPRMRVKGQMVCRDDGRIRYVGFVEDFTDERMKVSLTQATFGSTGWSPTSFKPGVIWTTPEGWTPCEWVKR